MKRVDTMDIIVYGNGSAENHGCEAITRGTATLLGGENRYILQSLDPATDRKYALNELADIWQAKKSVSKNLRFLYAYLKMRLAKNYTDMDGLAFVAGIKEASKHTKLVISVGGDNYCYPGTDIYGWLNKEYHKYGMKTVLWGCSVTPEVVAKSNVTKDLQRYNLIVARESITYKAIKKIQPNTVLAPDPAFFMESKLCDLDKRFQSKNVIGINISPMIISSERTSGIAYENYKNLISYILKNTDSYIALIPHVVWESNDDRKVLRKLYEDFDKNERLILVEDHSAPELKYIISKCRMFIGARTHATIAAYSTYVPTLVVGYSVKARGIALDLFGAEENYVLPVQNLREPRELTNAFAWLLQNEKRIRVHLERFLPTYLSTAQATVDAIKGLN